MAFYLYRINLEQLLLTTVLSLCMSYFIISGYKCTAPIIITRINMCYILIDNDGALMQLLPTKGVFEYL